MGCPVALASWQAARRGQPELATSQPSGPTNLQTMGRAAARGLKRPTHNPRKLEATVSDCGRETDGRGCIPKPALHTAGGSSSRLEAAGGRAVWGTRGAARCGMRCRSAQRPFPGAAFKARGWAPAPEGAVRPTLPGQRAASGVLIPFKDGEYPAGGEVASRNPNAELDPPPAHQHFTEENAQVK